MHHRAAPALWALSALREAEMQEGAELSCLLLVRPLGMKTAKPQLCYIILVLMIFLSPFPSVRGSQSTLLAIFNLCILATQRQIFKGF